MIELLQIQDFLQKVALGIALATDIDTQVFDCYCNRLAGTVVHPLPDIGGAVREVLKTGLPKVCTSPGNDSACSYCERKDNCPEKGFIHYPIFYHERVVGVIGMICFDEKQAAKIKDSKHHLSSFIEQMCDIIQLKLKEYEISEKEKEYLQETLLQNQFLNKIIGQISDGYLFVKSDGSITNYNASILHLLKISQKEILNENLFTLIPDPALKSLFNQNLHTVYERIVYRNKHYGVFISFFYDQKKLIGASINFKTIDQFGDRFGSSSSMVKINYTLNDYLGSTPEMIKIKGIAERAVNNHMNVLIIGENGTGKEMLAKAIHGSGNLAKNPFVILNCKSLHSDNIDEELFGGLETDNPSLKGSNTLGKLELANSGTLFLNNVDQLPIVAQFKLLSFLKNRYFQKRGSNRKIFIDVRIIAASRRNLSEMISEEAFLEDLYYMLNGIPIHLPPLRTRGEDIMLYANHMLEKYAPSFSAKNLHFDKKAALYLSHYSWPGNLHEMDNVIQYILSTHPGKGQLLTAEDLPVSIRQSQDHYNVPKKIHSTVEKSNSASLRNIENATIQEMLEKYGNTTADKKIIAQKLGISLSTLYRRLQELN